MSTEEEIMVSICCATYNHEKYIADALDGFLMQETDFKFEVLIHDDASTDKTAEIIRSYEQKYPDIIKPIYQTENQYSKGVKISSTFNFPRAKGKYIAICEGDDYWIDSRKLKKQIMKMDKCPGCYISFHPAIIKWENKSKENQIMCSHLNLPKIFTIEEVILGGGEFMPTNAIVINKQVVSRITSFFNFAKDAPVGDYYIQILGAENGGALYLDDVMSVYRKGCLGSWSERIHESSEQYISIIDSFIASNDKMDIFTNHKYSKQFIIYNNKTIAKITNSISIDMPYKKKIAESYYKRMNLKTKLLWHLIFKQHRIVNLLIKMRMTFYSIIFTKI